MCKHNVMEIILKHKYKYVDNKCPRNKLVYCHLIVNNTLAAGLHHCTLLEL